MLIAVAATIAFLIFIAILVGVFIYTEFKAWRDD